MLTEEQSKMAIEQLKAMRPEQEEDHDITLELRPEVDSPDANMDLEKGKTTKVAREHGQILEHKRHLENLRRAQAKYAAFLEETMRGSPADCPENTREPSVYRQMFAEFLGTGFMVTMGLAANSSAVIVGAQSGLFQIGMIWGIAIFLTIWSVGSISGAHINPAVSWAFAILRPSDFPVWKLPLYWVAQLAGGILAGCLNYLAFSTAIEVFESGNNLTRGESGSEWSAMVFGEYFPNPDIRQNSAYDIKRSTVTYGGCLGVEIFGTAVLMFTVLALNDPRNHLRPGHATAAFGVGMVVAILIAVYAPINQTGFNPARDFGPRLVAYGMGWGKIAIPGARGGFWCYIVGPLIGSPIGGAVHDFVLMRGI